MIQIETLPPLSSRMPVIVSKSKHFQLWGTDNLYPQRCEEVVKRSYLLKAVLDSITDFLMGEGFEDPNVASLVVNDSGLDGETLNKLLRKVCDTRSKWKAIALHIGYDMNYRFSSFNWIPIEFIRFPLPDENGSFSYVWYSTNWEQSRDKDDQSKQAIAYDIFNSDPDIVAMQIEDAGGIENYRGQILILTPQNYQYPIATFDPVIDHAQTQEEVGLFKLAYTQNGFLATNVFVYRGEFESKEEKDNFKQLIKRKTGARNANTNIGIQDKTGTLKVSDMVTSLQPSNLDRLFEFTENSVSKAIIENFGWPKILIGIQAENTLFNQEDIQNAYIYANAKTRNERMEISEVFSLLLSNWTKPIVTDAKIKEKVYGTPSVTATPAVATNPENVAQPKQNSFGQEPGSSLNDGVADSPRINTLLTNLTGRQSQSLDRIMKKYSSGKYSEGVARLMLKLSVGFTSEDLDEIFGELNSSKEL